jgi:Poly(ADP-ribose) polymerase catalytic domain
VKDEEVDSVEICTVWQYWARRVGMWMTYENSLNNSLECAYFHGASRIEFVSYGRTYSACLRSMMQYPSMGRNPELKVPIRRYEIRFKSASKRKSSKTTTDSHWIFPPLVPAGLRKKTYLYEIKLERYRTLRPTCSSKDKLEFEFVSSHFARLLNGKVFREVTQVDCIIYESQASVVQKYQTMKRHFWNSGKAKTEILVFHGTDSAAIQRIIGGGFKVGGTSGIPVRNGSSYGRGVYTSSEPEAAIQFGKRSGQVILAKVTTVVHQRDFALNLSSAALPLSSLIPALTTFLDRH